LFQQRAFAAAAWPDDGDELALTDRQGDIVQRMDAFVADGDENLLDARNLDNIRCCGLAEPAARSADTPARPASAVMSSPCAATLTIGAGLKVRRYHRRRTFWRHWSIVSP